MNGERLKLVISGPVGAGKTTFVASLSDIPVVNTDEVSSELIGKSTTTVALDFGALTLDGIQVYLFGTPGQERFAFAWDTLLEGAFGLVFLVAGNQPATFPTARRMLDYLTTNFPVPFVVGVTRKDLAQVWSAEEVASYFRLPAPHVLAVNATSREDCREVLLQILRFWGVAGTKIPPEKAEHAGTSSH